jgi:uncharacterized protein (TIGR00661 family)
LEETKKNILIAPLNWGLGHAIRCIPIINQLIAQNFNPILASDGAALEILKKEFPHLVCLELPSYHIEYQGKKGSLKLKLLKNSPKIIQAVFAEKKLTKKWIAQYNLHGIISDNRLGVRHKKITSVYITHQLNVLSGSTTWLSSKMHQFYINKFNQCWVPDVDGVPNLTGDLGHLGIKNEAVKYIGPLSRLEKKELKKKYDLMVILSGPEPQRTFLEEKLLQELQEYKGRILFVKGIMQSQQFVTQENQFTIYNYMTSQEIENAFNQSDLVISRSGYTTVMDLAKLEKKAFFIPTPGQYEQEYLAKKYKKEGLVPYCKQDKFKLKKLLEVDLYKGFQSFNTEIDWKVLFAIFN